MQLPQVNLQAYRCIHVGRGHRNIIVLMKPCTVDRMLKMHGLTNRNIEDTRSEIEGGEDAQFLQF